MVPQVEEPVPALESVPQTGLAAPAPIGEDEVAEKAITVLVEEEELEEVLVEEDEPEETRPVVVVEEPEPRRPLHPSPHPHPPLQLNQNQFHVFIICLLLIFNKPLSILGLADHRFSLCSGSAAVGHLQNACHSPHSQGASRPSAKYLRSFTHSPPLTAPSALERRVGIVLAKDVPHG